MNVLARKMGFKDAATMSAYYQRQQEMRSVANGTGQGSDGVASPSPSPALPPKAKQGMSWHPAFLLQSLLDKWNAATQ
jgi:hypothetical protein